MKRRDFLKTAAIGAGVLASSMVSGDGGANAAESSGKQGKDFHKVDAFSHFAPTSYLDHLRSLGGPPHLMSVYSKAMPELSDVYGLEPRLKMMAEEGIDVAIIFPQPDIESGLGPLFMAERKALSAARFINDAMAKICEKNPKFKFNALLPMTNKEDMTAEFNRSINLPGMVGVGVNTGPLTSPPDDELHMALYALAAPKKMPIWVHLNRGATSPDFMMDPVQPSPPFPPNTRVSPIYSWLNFGYLADGSAHMMRLVTADVFKKYPGLRIIVHQRGHLIPLYKDRIKAHFRTFQGLNLPPIGTPPNFDVDYAMEQLKQFYVDAICMGDDTDLLTRSVNFFGADHVMYATDTAYSPNGGRHTAQMTCNSILKLPVSDAAMKNIFAGNIQRLMDEIVRG